MEEELLKGKRRAAEFYDENGNFIPLNDHNNGNMSEEIATLRDTYMQAEREYFEELLSDDGLYAYFLELKNSNVDDLIKKITELHDKLETGELATEKDKELMERMNPEERDNYYNHLLEHTEAILCLTLASVRDLIMVKTKVKKEEKEERLKKIMEEYEATRLEYEEQVKSERTRSR